MFEFVNLLHRNVTCQVKIIKYRLNTSKKTKSKSQFEQSNWCKEFQVL